VIVVDTNVVAYYLLGGPEAGAATATLFRDPDWVAPPLWRSEFRSVVAKHMRFRELSLEGAAAIFDRAERLFGHREHPVDSAHVLALAMESGCSTYDCEFVSLAMQRQAKVVTADGRLVRAFPGVAIHLNDFVQEQR
jgi:predicted nucleic acid-binding protein